MSYVRVICRTYDLYVVRTTYISYVRLISRTYDLYVVRTTYMSYVRLISRTYDLYLVRTTYISPLSRRPWPCLKLALRAMAIGPLSLCLRVFPMECKPRPSSRQLVDSDTACTFARQNRNIPSAILFYFMFMHSIGPIRSAHIHILFL